MLAIATGVWYGKIPVGISWSLAYTSFAAIMLLGYLRIRKAPSRSAAALKPRRVSDFLPYHWLAIAIVVSLCPLFYVHDPDVGISAIVVTICALISVLVAIELTRLPASFAGSDPVIEAQLDSKLRYERSRVFLSIVFLQTGLFFGFANLGRSGNALGAGVSLSIEIIFAAFVWSSILRGWRQRMKDPNAAQ
jgi:hypothetical protein